MGDAREQLAGIGRRSSSIRAGLAWLGLVAIGCAGGEPLTTDAIDRARQTWERAGLRDYDLEWTSSGQTRGHYRVTVRGARVTRIDSILPDGRAIEVHPARADLYGVDGLFVVLEDELAQLGADAPFGQPKGTSAVLRFTPDPDLGYPRSYHRDVVGAPRGLAIDVIRLDRASPLGPSSEAPRNPEATGKEHRLVGRREGPGLPVGPPRGPI